ncbi:hypothetical protein ACWCQN_41855 [Streptomyces sp. NPDC001984]|uniref:hypothetical protein n=1 Tax=Streptomyces sp. NPDC002619 TaxID=3364655 RepID=UPI0036A79F1D
MKSRSLPRSSASRHLLRPVVELLDKRIERQVHSAVARSQSENGELKRDIQVLGQHRYTFDLLVGPRARGISRIVVPGAMDRLQAEVAALGGGDRQAAERNVAAAFRLLVALESLGVGRIAGGTMNIRGKLGSIPLLDPPNDEILEIARRSTST